MSDVTVNPGIDEKKRFEIHLDALKEAYKELIDTSFKVTSILLLVLAWFVSHKNPLGMLCQFTPLAYLALAFTTLGWLLLIYLFNLLYLRSDRSYKSLRVLGYEEILFDRYRVTRGMMWAVIFGHFTMLVGIFSLILLRYIIHVNDICGISGSK